MSDALMRARSASCPGCGSAIVPTAVFCVTCGYNLGPEQRLPVASSTGSMIITDLSPNPYRSPTNCEDDFDSPSSFLRKLWELFALRGRISRKHWLLVHLAFLLMECVFGAMELTNTSLGNFEAVLVAPILFFLWVIFAAHVRRWHDIDRSGWWVIVNIIPVLGWLYSFLKLGFQRGTEGPNKYGNDPMHATADRVTQ